MNIQSSLPLRNYRIVLDDDLLSFVNSLETIFIGNSDGSNAEYLYAIRELYPNEVLDLKIGESMFFQHNRDDKNSKGIIKRIK